MHIIQTPCNINKTFLTSFTMHVRTYPPLTSPLTVIVVPMTSLGSGLDPSVAHIDVVNRVEVDRDDDDGANAWMLDASRLTRSTKFWKMRLDFMFDVFVDLMSFLMFNISFYSS